MKLESNTFTPTASAVALGIVLWLGASATTYAHDDHYRGSSNNHEISQKKAQKDHQKREKEALKKHQREERFLYGNGHAIREHQQEERDRLKNHQRKEDIRLKRHQDFDHGRYDN